MAGEARLLLPYSFCAGLPQWPPVQPANPQNPAIPNSRSHPEAAFFAAATPGKQATSTKPVQFVCRLPPPLALS
jgi:hypothetical protein